MKKLSIVWISEDAKKALKKVAADNRQSMVAYCDDLILGKKRGKGGFSW